MSYNYQPPDMDDSSDIELVSHAAPASSSARLVEPVRGNNIDNGHQSATRSSPSRQDYADFFAEATTAASNASASMLAAQSGQDRRAGSLNPKTGTPANDIIEIGSDDSDSDGNDYIAGPSSAAAATYRDRGPSGHGHVQAGQPNILGRTHSTPSAVFDSKGKGKARLFERIDSEDEDELPDLASIAGPGNSLKRSSSDTIAALSKRPSEQGSTTFANERNARNGLSPIPASSPPLPSFSGNTYDYASRLKHNHSRLPSEVDSSDDEIVRPTKRRANPQQQPTSDADPAKVKPPTKKQLLEQERAAKKAQKEKEKAEKAVSRSRIYLCS